MEPLVVQGLADAASVYSELVICLGEYLEGASFVLPDADHFPDKIDTTPEGFGTLFRRVLSYTPLPDDEPFTLHFVAPEEEEGGKSCSSGACGPELSSGSVRGLLGHDGAGEWTVPVHVQDASNSVRLTSHFAWCAGAMLLTTADAVGKNSTPSEADVRGEIAAVACGFAPLLLAASHIVMRGCGGVRVHRGTALPTEVLAGLAVLFAAHHDDARGLRKMRGLLEATQQDALDDAVAYFSKRKSFSAKFREDPTCLALHCDFGPEEGLLGRVFGNGNGERSLPLR